MSATSRRTSTSSRSPASSRVEPRGSTASSPRTISETSASRGSPRSRSRAPTAASPGRITCSTTSAPSSRTVPTSSTDGDRCGSSEVTPQPAGDGLDRRALQQGREHDGEEDDVEELLVGVHALDHREHREHDRHRAAQPRPAEQRLLAQLEAAAERGHDRRERAGEEDDHEREQRALPRDLVEVGGEDEQAEREEHAELRDPGEAFVERGHGAPGREARRAEREPAQVDGEEARAVQRRGEAERAARRPRATRRGRGPGWRAARARRPRARATRRRRRRPGRSRAAGRTGGACPRSRSPAA